MAETSTQKLSYLKRLFDIAVKKEKASKLYTTHKAAAEKNYNDLQLILKDIEIEKVPMSIVAKCNFSIFLIRESIIRCVDKLKTEHFRFDFVRFEIPVWSLILPDGRDSLLSEEHYYTFVQKDEGAYNLRFEIIDKETPYIHNFTVNVVHELVEYSRYISRVLKYKPE